MRTQGASNKGIQVFYGPGDSRGFTLIEVMITLFVCVAALTFILFANERVGSANELAFQRMRALQDAHQVVERMRETATYARFPDNVMSAFPNGEAVTGFDSLPGEEVVVSYTGTEDLLDVTVAVSWLGENGRAMEYRLHTFITQRE